MLLEYHFQQPGAKPAQAPTSLQSEVPAPLPTLVRSKDAVQMAPMEVTGARMADLGGWAPAPAQEPATVASKLGMGLKRMKLGKAHVFVYRIFYVPYLIGIEW
jgi:hypothetical protein